ncbi:MAG: hypothetical protein IJ083_04570 [Clostridia bacterium]|nr:hypothetical protein [Clostridia bacterium]
MADDKYVLDADTLSVEQQIPGPRRDDPESDEGQWHEMPKCLFQDLMDNARRQQGM